MILKVVPDRKGWSQSRFQSGRQSWLLQQVCIHLSEDYIINTDEDDEDISTSALEQSRSCVRSIRHNNHTIAGGSRDLLAPGQEYYHEEDCSFVSLPRWNTFRNTAPRTIVTSANIYKITL